jgi:hypothetical protein
VFIAHPEDGARRAGEPRVFIGSIACANRVLKNPVHRDQIRKDFNVRAVEMEGFGIAEASWASDIGYFIVRGICDYCDANKGDPWQGYAAIVAAAYTRALFEETPPDPKVIGASGVVARQVRAESISQEDLKRAADNFIAAGRPASILALFPNAPLETRAAIEQLAALPRTLAFSQQATASIPIKALAKHPDKRHLILAPPGAGKTHALWRAANTLRSETDVVPIFLRIGGIERWSEALKFVGDVSGLAAPQLLTDERVCLLLDGWSEFAPIGEEHAVAMRSLHQTRIIATARRDADADARFSTWTLDPLPFPAIRRAFESATGRGPPPSSGFDDLLRLPLAA